MAHCVAHICWELCLTVRLSFPFKNVFVSMRPPSAATPPAQTSKQQALCKYKSVTDHRMNQPRSTSIVFCASGYRGSTFNKRYLAPCAGTHADNMPTRTHHINMAQRFAQPGSELSVGTRCNHTLKTPDPQTFILPQRVDQTCYLEALDTAIYPRPDTDTSASQ